VLPKGSRRRAGRETSWGAGARHRVVVRVDRLECRLAVADGAPIARRCVGGTSAIVVEASQPQPYLVVRPSALPTHGEPQRRAAVERDGWAREYRTLLPGPRPASRSSCVNEPSCGGAGRRGVGCCVTHTSRGSPPRRDRAPSAPGVTAPSPAATPAWPASSPKPSAHPRFPAEPLASASSPWPPTARRISAPPPGSYGRVAPEPDVALTPLSSAARSACSAISSERSMSSSV
jgi:hypothetical protein